jgi:hypothetical protein
MASSNDDVWPPPSFKVFSASGRYVGFGCQGLDCFEVYLPGGKDEGWCGSIEGNDIFFSSEELAGRVEGTKLLYDDGAPAGHISGNTVFTTDGLLAGRVEGAAPPAAVAGAILLLILNHWDQFRS